MFKAECLNYKPLNNHEERSHVFGCIGLKMHGVFNHSRERYLAASQSFRLLYSNLQTLREGLENQDGWIEIHNSNVCT